MYNNPVRSVPYYSNFVYQYPHKLPILWALLVIFMLSNPAFAQTDPYTISNIPVETQGKTATDARNQAMSYAESHAFSLLLKQLTPHYKHDKLPSPPPREIAKMVQGIEVEQEKVIGNHYKASISVSFYPHYIQSLLENNGITTIQHKAQPLLVVPVFTRDKNILLFDEENLWKQAWDRAEKHDNHLINYTLPIGDLDDLMLLSADMAVNGTYKNLQPLAQKYSAENILVAHAKYVQDPITKQPSLNILLRRIGPNAAKSSAVSFTGNAEDDLSKLLGSAAYSIIDQLDNQWKITEGAAASSQQRYILHVPFSDLYEWRHIRRQIEQADFIQKFDITALTSRTATIEISSKLRRDALLLNFQKKGLGAHLQGDKILLTLNNHPG